MSIDDLLDLLKLDRERQRIMLAWVMDCKARVEGAREMRERAARAAVEHIRTHGPNGVRAAILSLPDTPEELTIAHHVELPADTPSNEVATAFANLSARHPGGKESRQILEAENRRIKEFMTKYEAHFIQQRDRIRELEAALWEILNLKGNGSAEWQAAEAHGIARAVLDTPEEQP